MSRVTQVSPVLKVTRAQRVLKACVEILVIEGSSALREYQERKDRLVVLVGKVRNIKYYLVLLWRLFTPSGVRSALNRMQFASDLASDLESEAPFHFKQIHRTRDPRLLWTQSMAPNLCFRERQTFFAHNFKRKSTRYSILSLQVAFLSSATLCC